jgi:hypothetical protein
MSFIRVSGGIVGLFLIGVVVAWGATILVPDDYDTIQEAVDAASWGDEILVGPGTFSDPTHEAGYGDVTMCCVIMKSGIRLRGAGIGQTIIDADSSGRGIHLYQCEDVQISRFTITGAFAENYGGAIFCRQSSPYVHHCEIVENWDGGIAMIEDSHPTIEHCLMHHNLSKNGGGLEVELSCEPYVYDCDIIDNEAPFAAGVMLRGSATLDHCRISGNQTTGGDTELGGGILAVDDVTPMIIDCEITNNVGSGGGGGIALMGEGTAGVIEGCLIAGNVSPGLEARGGGIYILGQATPVIRDCIIAENSTSGPWSDGGGLYVHLSGVELTNCTFYANWTDSEVSEAGNIGLETSMFLPIPISITHSIVVDSPVGKGVHWIGTGDPPLISCSDVHGNAGGDDICGTGTGNFSLDPLLCDPAADNFHIEDGSPCAPGNHPEGPGACDGLLIGAKREGCSSGIDDPVSPGVVRLLGNRPNPFSGRTMISFALEQERQVSLEVLDPSGRRIALLYEGRLEPGLQEIPWDGFTNQGVRAGSGVYFYRLRCGSVTEGLRMLHLR